jgi:hypothetical protein
LIKGKIKQTIHQTKINAFQHDATTIVLLGFLLKPELGGYYRRDFFIPLDSGCYKFEEGDHVYLKVSPLREMRRFKVKGKLSPRFIGPFMIFRRVGEMAYQLELPASLSDVQNVFHVSQLRSVSMSLRNSYQ